MRQEKDTMKRQTMLTPNQGRVIWSKEMATKEVGKESKIMEMGIKEMRQENDNMLANKQGRVIMSKEMAIKEVGRESKIKEMTTMDHGKQGI